MFIRNETFYSFRKNYPIITTLVFIHLVLFLWINLSRWSGGLVPFGSFLLEAGIGNNNAVAHGQYWRLLTPIFLHIGAAHVLFNSFSLILFGPALERMLGKVKFIIIYAGTGVLANIATFLLTGPYYTHLGASGAIFGLFGVYLYMIVFRKDLIDAANAQIITVILILGVVMTFLNPGINISAHIFGLISGALLAPLFVKNAVPFHITAPARDRGVSFDPNRWKKRRYLSSQRVLRLIGWAFLLLVIIGILSRLLPF
ncbi:rhomboid family intramembrane serine protease [Bacillus piscicola]|uniref:rhomboid family intramembrane serine protease n=1 Tax=Bacillus piscicola TaxID=1632684 RepID=UPI001F0992DE|nr:rhomboid family intramembrane serine protease [Bacillus piscicola]